MKLILLGNAGAGKSTLSRKLLNKQPAAVLSLDEVAFAESAVRRPVADSVADVEQFILSNEHWILEGCYADILQPVLCHAEQMIYLNPGVETCIAHCEARPWEPSKFDSEEEQNANLQNLIGWVKNYAQRQDEYGLAAHRALFDAFTGKKVEYSNAEQYANGADIV